MNLIRSISKNKVLISLNFIFIILLIFFPPIFFTLYKDAKYFFQTRIFKTDPRSKLAAYKDKNFAKEVLYEFNNLKSEYKPFLGWRRLKFESKYTNIQGKYNTRLSTNQSLENSIWFFGGSNVWGTGTSDKGTIPSVFAEKTGNLVFNFGESGWNTRQSINQLINLIGDGHKPKKIIFFNGSNDIISNCIARGILPSHFREPQIKVAMNKRKKYKRFAKWLVKPYIDFYQNLSFLNYREFTNQGFSREDLCINDSQKENLVADHYINNLHTAYLLSKNLEVDFYSIIQPSLYTSKSLHTMKISDKGPGYYSEKKITDLIIKKVSKNCKFENDFCNRIIDGRSWLDNTKDVFIDTHHINLEGNKIIADNIQKLLNNQNNM